MGKEKEKRKEKRWEKGVESRSKTKSRNHKKKNKKRPCLNWQPDAWALDKKNYLGAKLGWTFLFFSISKREKRWEKRGERRREGNGGKSKRKTHKLKKVRATYWVPQTLYLLQNL
jgi:hypothetical protein